MTGEAAGWEALDGVPEGRDVEEPAESEAGTEIDLDADGPADEPAERERLSRERIARVQRLLRDAGAEGALLSTRRAFSWLTVGGVAHVLQAAGEGVASVLVTRDEAVVLTSRIEAARIADEELDGLSLPMEPFDWFTEDGANAAAAARVRGTLLRDEHLEAVLQPERSILSPLEQGRMAWLGAHVQEALERALASAHRDLPEDSLAADATMILGGAGIRAPVVLVASDGRIELYRHPLPGRSRIQRRVMLVLVGERWGLHVAATAFRELEEPSAELQKRQAATQHVLAAMTAATRDGSTFGGVFAAAQEAYRTAGFPDEWRLHHQGGSIGYGSRERVAAPDDPTPIRSGMAFAWNPSITGAKAETTFLLLPGDEVRAVA